MPRYLPRGSAYPYRAAAGANLLPVHLSQIHLSLVDRGRCPIEEQQGPGCDRWLVAGSLEDLSPLLAPAVPTPAGGVRVVTVSERGCFGVSTTVSEPSFIVTSSVFASVSYTHLTLPTKRIV